MPRPGLMSRTTGTEHQVETPCVRRRPTLARAAENGTRVDLQLVTHEGNTNRCLAVPASGGSRLQAQRQEILQQSRFALSLATYLRGRGRARAARARIHRAELEGIRPNCTARLRREVREVLTPT